MFIGLFERETLLEFLPKGARVAEIGVACGDFSAKILEVCRPKELHLIDPWEFQNRADYLADTNNVSQAEQDLRFQAIEARFEREIAEKQVHLHRAYSVAAAERFADASFDWVYIDAMHTYEGLRDDLNAWAPKLKAEGLLIGDDFAENVLVARQHWGVVPAVKDFLKQSSFELLLLTFQAYGNFMMARKPLHPRVKAMLLNVLSHNHVIELPGALKDLDFFQHVVPTRDGHSGFMCWSKDPRNDSLLSQLIPAPNRAR